MVSYLGANISKIFISAYIFPHFFCLHLIPFLILRPFFFVFLGDITKFSITAT